MRPSIRSTRNLILLISARRILILMVTAVEPDTLDWMLGMRFYLTAEDGMGGILKEKPEDFIVEELSTQDLSPDGGYLILNLEKRDWEMHNLVRAISRILRISKNRINWAGTKDKRALTRQRISIWKVEEWEIERLRLEGVKLDVIGRSRKKVALGNLQGNRFEITVRGVDPGGDELESRLLRVQDAIREVGGVINYFGYQRFGIQRPINHLAGELILRGEFKKAVMLFLTATFGSEDRVVEAAREYIRETEDFKRGLELMPQGLHIERTMLHALVNNPGDYPGAFLALPKQLYLIFIHAYQSYVFNLIVSARLEEGLGFNESHEGDIVCFADEHGFPNAKKWQIVRKGEVDGINNLIKRGRAFITAPLIGFDTTVAEGVEGEIEHRILEKLDIDLEAFRMVNASEFASKGLRREIKLLVDPSFKVLGDRDVRFSFTLPKGGYATTVLREFMKVKNTPGKGFEPLRG